MKNSKNKRTVIMLLILLGLIAIAYKVMFVAPVDESLLVEDNIVAGERVVQILKDVESINFDLSVFGESKFTSLKTIETPLPSLPVGKKNPFTAAN